MAPSLGSGGLAGPECLTLMVLQHVVDQHIATQSAALEHEVGVITAMQQRLQRLKNQRVETQAGIDRLIRTADAGLATRSDVEEVEAGGGGGGGGGGGAAEVKAESEGKEGGGTTTAAAATAAAAAAARKGKIVKESVSAVASTNRYRLLLSTTRLSTLLLDEMKDSGSSVGGASPVEGPSPTPSWWVPHREEGAGGGAARHKGGGGGVGGGAGEEGVEGKGKGGGEGGADGAGGGEDDLVSQLHASPEWTEMVQAAADNEDRWQDRCTELLEAIEQQTTLDIARGAAVAHKENEMHSDLATAHDRITDLERLARQLAKAGRASCAEARRVGVDVARILRRHDEEVVDGTVAANILLSASADLIEKQRAREATKRSADEQQRLRDVQEQATALLQEATNRETELLRTIGSMRVQVRLAIFVIFTVSTRLPHVLEYTVNYALRHHLR